MIKVIAISDLLCESQTIWPSNFSTSGTIIVFLDFNDFPQTPCISIEEHGILSDLNVEKSNWNLSHGRIRFP